MIGSFPRFDMARKPMPQRHYLMPLIWSLSFPSKWRHHTEIKKTDMDGVKPPFLLLCNHNSFMDFKIMTAAVFPYRTSYVVAIDGFIGWEWLLRRVGAIGTRKFTNDVLLVRNMLHLLNTGNTVTLYPEARYSLCGTSAVLPKSLAKFIKLANVPVATLIMHGHHISSPFWNTKGRHPKHLRAEMKLLFTAEQTKSASLDEISEMLKSSFYYDDYAWQKEHSVLVRKNNRAKGLHKVLYQCPHCKTEYRMSSNGNNLSCGNCGKTWQMTQLGELQAVTGETEFSHIPDWYEWERENVRREVAAGSYHFSAPVQIDSLPNAKRFIDLGMGTLTHDLSGFVLKGTYGGKAFEERWSSKFLYSCHIEYNYRKKGECIDLNTLNDTLYLFPAGSDFAVTKIALATEEIYKFVSEDDVPLIEPQPA